MGSSSNPINIFSSSFYLFAFAFCSLRCRFGPRVGVPIYGHCAILHRYVAIEHKIVCNRWMHSCEIFSFTIISRTITNSVKKKSLYIFHFTKNVVVFRFYCWNRIFHLFYCYTFWSRYIFVLNPRTKD